MKKKNLALLASIALASATALASCGKKNNTTTDDITTTDIVDTTSVVPTTSDATPTTTVEPDTRLTVTFDTMGGNSIEDVKGEAGEKLSAPADPTKDYFKFVGWYADKAYTTPYTFDKIPSTNITIYAKWTPVLASYINFDSNGGTAVASIYGNEGTTIELPAAPTKPGFTFAGWYTDNTFETEFTDTTFGTEVLNLVAKWEAVEGQYSITYHIGDDTKEVFIEDGKVLLADDLIPSDTILDGWYLDSEYKTKATAGVTLTESIDLYASVYTKGLKFSSDNRLVIGYTGDSKNVYLPTVLNGTKVEAIAEEAFYGNKTITSVYIPETITSIGTKAFYNCEYLVEAKLSPLTESMGSYAFYGCKRLENIETIGKLKGINEGVFAGCKLLKPVDLSNVTGYGSYAFAGNEKITELVLAEGLVQISEYAFADMKNLVSVSIPSTVTQISVGAFRDDTKLTRVTVAAENAKYKVTDLGLEVKDTKVLVLYLGNEDTVALPDYYIYPYAFSGNTTIKTLDCTSMTLAKGSLEGLAGLEELTIDLDGEYLAYYFGASSATTNGTANTILPDTLTTVHLLNNPDTIAANTFYGARHLTTVTGLDKVTEIGAYAFAYTAIKEFALPENLATLDYSAFYGNKEIKSFTATDANTTYKTVNGCIYNKDATELVMVPAGADSIAYADTLKVIKGFAFYGASIRSVVIPSTIESLEKNALTGVLGLTELETPYIGDGKTNNYMHYLFGIEKKVEITETDGEETRKVSFDSYNTVPRTLRHVIITKPVTEISEYAFAYFEGLDNLEVTGVEKICQYAFIRTGFTKIVIPATVKTVEKFAYGYCYNLTEADIYSETLEMGIFAYSFRLQEVTFEDGVKAIPDLICYPYREQDSFYGEDTIYSSLKTIKIYPSVESIGESAFYYAGMYDDNIYDLTVDFVNASESKLTTIGQFAFANSALKKIELPASVETVGSRAFAFSDSIETVTFGTKEEGSKLKTIGSLCFALDTVLDSVTIHKAITTASELPYLEPFIPDGSTSSVYPFYYANEKFKLYVPANAVQTYKMADNYLAAGITSRINAIK